MNTMLKLATLGALLACAGIAAAGNAPPVASFEYLPGSARINPQPLPPEQLSSAVGSADRATSFQYPSGQVRINPQPLPPLDSRLS
jgi:hypothetical protein